MNPSVEPNRSLDDPEVIESILQYQHLPTSQRAAARNEILSRFPDFAEDLAACLDGLELMASFSSDLRDVENDTTDRDVAHEAAFHEHLAKQDLGDFQLLREIGRGGMGVVYEATQRSLGRRVAVKILPFAAFVDSKCLQRFKQEAQAAAILRHPHIVSVHFVGCERGVHYYAMDLVDGHTLADLIEQLQPSDQTASDFTSTPQLETLDPHGDTSPMARLSTQHSERRPEYIRFMARMGSQLADALHYAHENGVIHRDIKPSNILLDAQCKPWITDFGLAQVKGDNGLTITGDLVGTLRYMSPEQAEGKKLLDQRTDIYSLGATLYETLTLHPALDGNDRPTLLRQLEDHQPRRPRAADPQIPTDLETILLKAMSRFPEDRYETAAELGDDLCRFLEHKPILAKRQSRLRYAWSWIRRHRLVATLLFLVMSITLALAVIGPLVAAKYARLARREAEARRLADASRTEMQSLLSGTMRKVADVLEREPRFTDQRMEIMAGIVSSYERMRQLNPDDPEIGYQLAVELTELGRIQMVYGDFDLSIEKTSRAIDLLNAISETHPKELKYQVTRANATGVLAAAKTEQQGHPDLELYRNAVEIMERVFRRARPDDYVAEWNFQRMFLAIALGNSGRTQDGSELLREVIETDESFVKRFPADHDHHSEIAYASTYLARFQIRLGQVHEAETLLRRALAIYEVHAAGVESGWIVNLQIARLECERNLGGLLYRLRCTEEAKLHLEKAIGELEEITVEHANVHWARRELCNAYLSLVPALCDLNQLDEAEAAVHRALENCDYSTDSKKKRFSHHVSLLMYELGLIRFWKHDLNGAKQAFAQIEQFLDNVEASNLAEDERLARVLLHANCPLKEFQKPDLAIKYARQNFEAKKTGETWQLLGMAQYRAGNWRDALDSIQQSVAAQNGGDAVDFLLLAMIFHQLGEPEKARQQYEKALLHIDGPIIFCSIRFSRQLSDLRAEAEYLLGSNVTNP